MCSELDQERKARYAIKQKLKGNIYLLPETPKTWHTPPKTRMQVLLFKDGAVQRVCRGMIDPLMLNRARERLRFWFFHLEVLALRYAADR